MNPSRAFPSFDSVFLLVVSVVITIAIIFLWPSYSVWTPRRMSCRECDYLEFWFSIPPAISRHQPERTRSARYTVLCCNQTYLIPWQLACAFEQFFVEGHAPVYHARREADAMLGTHILSRFLRGFLGSHDLSPWSSSICDMGSGSDGRTLVKGRLDGDDESFLP